MVIVNVLIDIDLPFVQSLKGRRAVLNKMKEKLKKMNLSILDVSGEYAKEGTLAAAFLSHNDRDAFSYVQQIEALLERDFPEIEWKVSYEVI